MTAQHVKVVLTGEGADELFAGYEYLCDFDDAESLQAELIRTVEGLHNLNLQRCDRVTMAHGLEARVPFLDRQVIAYALRPADGVEAAARRASPRSGCCARPSTAGCPTSSCGAGRPSSATAAARRPCSARRVEDDRHRGGLRAERTPSTRRCARARSSPTTASSPSTCRGAAGARRSGASRRPDAGRRRAQRQPRSELRSFPPRVGLLDDLGRVLVLRTTT